MAGYVSPTPKKLMVQELFGLTQSLNFGNVYIGFATSATAPSIDSTGYYAGFTEPTDASYARECIGDYSQSALKYFGQTPATLTINSETGAVTIKNSKEIKFDTYRGSGSLSVKYLMLMDGETVGHCLMFFELESIITLAQNEILTVPVGNASATLS